MPGMMNNSLRDRIMILIILEIDCVLIYRRVSYSRNVFTSLVVSRNSGFQFMHDRRRSITIMNTVGLFDLSGQIEWAIHISPSIENIITV